MHPDEIVTPPRGNCTIIHHTASASYAAQIVILSSLTRMYERKDWSAQIVAAHEAGQEPLIMQRPLFEAKRPAEPPISKPKASFSDEPPLHKEPYLPSLGDY